MLRSLVIFILLLTTQASFALEQSGRFEVSENGENYWLPRWMSFNLYEDFKQKINSDSEQCEQPYKKLFSKADVRWSIYFGYGDGDGDQYTSDFAERDLFEKQLNSACSPKLPQIQLCGFEMENKTAGQYVKQIKTKENTLVNIHIQLLNASLTSEAAVNLESADQKKKSVKLEKSFLNSLHTDDIVFYSGHARYGSGPGFRPLPRKSKDWWVATLFRPMVNNMMQSLNPPEREISFEGQPVNPALIGLFSCEAEAHYGADLTRNSPETSLILTRQSISFADNMRLLYAASNNILSETCEDQFQNNMNQAMTMAYSHKKEEIPKSFDPKKLPKIFNFFHKDQVRGKNDILLYLRNKGEVGTEVNKPAGDDG